MALDATFWATIALLIFLAIMVYFKVPGMMARALDERSARIRSDLDEARRLRDEAQALLAEYQAKRRDAEKEAEDIVASARREATQIVGEAKQKTEDYVTRRTALAEQKIAQAEREAVNEVRSKAVDIAVAAAQRLIEQKAGGQKGAELFQASLQQVKSRLN